MSSEDAWVAAATGDVGQMVRVDPRAHRHATAVEADTAVLALGGESAFLPSPSEWIERARPHICTNPAADHPQFRGAFTQDADLGDLLTQGQDRADTSDTHATRLARGRSV